MDGKVAFFCIVAYLIPSTWEAIAHKLLLHATTQARFRWRRWGMLGQLFRQAHFYHYRIHHRRTYRPNLFTQFRDAREKEHLDAALKGEIAERLQANRYGTTISAPWEVITYVAIPLIVSIALFLSLAPSMLPMGIILSFGPYLLTKYVHPILHMSSEEISAIHGKFVQIIAKTPAFQFLQTYHHRHHRNENCHFNLMLGADWIILNFFRAFAQCKAKLN